MRSTCALLFLTALAAVHQAHAAERAPASHKHNDTKAVIPAITGIVSPAFFSYASGVAVKACAFPGRAWP